MRLMPFNYIGQYQWVTNPDRWEPPFFSDLLGGLDLRSLPQCGKKGGTPSGVALFVYASAKTDPGLVPLGQSLDFQPSTLIKTTVESRLGLPRGSITAQTLRNILRQLFLELADSTGQNRVKPLMPTLAGLLDIHLGGYSLVSSENYKRYSRSDYPLVLETLRENYRRIRASPDGENGTHRKVLGAWMLQYGEPDHRVFIPAGLPDEGWEKPDTTFTDAFNRADGPIGADWVDILSTFSVATNQVKHDTDVKGVVRMASALASDAHYGQADTPTIGTNFNVDGVTCRNSTDAGGSEDYYGFGFQNSSSGLCFKVVDGTDTTIGASISITRGAPDTMKQSANGSTLEMFYNGTSLTTRTDTALTGQLRCGMRQRDPADRWDNFEAADLAAATFDLDRLEREALRGGLRGVMRGGF